MTISFLDVCRFVAAAGGTADFAVSAAVTGYQTPAAAGAANGATYRYRAESADLTQWEVGYGVYTSGTTTLARSTVLYSSNANTKVNFAAAPTVGIVYLAEDAMSSVNNLADVASAATARANLGLGVAMRASKTNGSNVSSTADSSSGFSTTTMGGQGWTFTPNKIGTILVIHQATMDNASGHIIDFALQYGTGTPPSAGAAYTGTMAAFAPVTPASTSEIMETPLIALIAGLTVGTTYWFDIAFGARGGGTTHLWNPNVIVLELAA
jgi:hypothetical protein